MVKLKTWELMNARIDEIKTGPRAGERKAVKLPEDAIPLNAYFENGAEFIYYLVPKR